MALRDEEHARRLRLAAGMRRVSRRSFLIGSAFGLATAADLVATKTVQEQRRLPQILNLPDTYAEENFPSTSWILFPGYKTSWEEGLFILHSLRPALTQRGQMAVAGYSNQGMDLQHLAEVLDRYVNERQLRHLYFYGHSFGGMVAVEMTARMLAKGVDVRLIMMDSSPYSRFDVLDQAMFESVVFFYEAGYRVPSYLRGGYELGERIVNKHERSWRQVLEQTLEQLSPLAVSSTLIQSQSSYIYHFDAKRFQHSIRDTKIAWMGNPDDGTVDYRTARRSWSVNFKANLLTADLVTHGALPAHASPQWNPGIYQPLIEGVEDEFFPMPGGGKSVSVY
jgi:pimeloyl-ACP methyl ester carboxylesterase